MTRMPGEPLEPGVSPRGHPLKLMSSIILQLRCEIMLRPCLGLFAGPGGKQYSSRLQKGRMPVEGTPA